MAPAEELLRWTRALERSLKNEGPWKSVVELQQEIGLPLERQLFVLDALQEASSETRALIAPIFKNLMAQWLVFDAIREADERGVHYSTVLDTNEFHNDLRFLLARCHEDDDVNRGGIVAPEWMWDILLDSLPKYEQLSEEILQAIHAAASQSLKDGKAFQEKGNHGRAVAVFAAALRSCDPVYVQDMSAGLGVYTIASGIAVIRTDLWKAMALSCYSLGLARMSYIYAEKVLECDAQAYEAVFSKANALQLLERQGLKAWLTRRTADPSPEARIQARNQPALPPAPVSGGRKSRGAFSRAVEAKIGALPPSE